MIDYVPAELKANKDWLVVFRYKNSKGEMTRKRIRVPKMSNKTLRTRYAKRLCAEINSKLERGWNPEMEMEAANSFKLLKVVISEFINYTETEIKNGNLRNDTLRSYKSYLRILSNYLNLEETELHCINFNRQLVAKFLDYLTVTRQVSNRTYNNYIVFLSTFSTYMLKREYISKNPLEGVSKKKEGEKIRTTISKNTLAEIQDYLAINNPPYLILCLCTYSLFLRRTELTKLKVRDMHIDENYVVIPAEISKNKKNDIVTIPNEFKQLLANHIARAKQTDYVFSVNDFFPGSEQLNPKKISDEWAKMRRKLKFSHRYQFYSLKDTGITNMLEMGVPAIKVRDQARHYDLSITEKYTPRRKVADKQLVNFGCFSAIAVS